MKKLSNRSKYLFLAPLFLVASLVLQFANVQFASAATRTWTGAGDGTTFSDAANWGGTVPGANDILNFGVVGSGAYTEHNLVNDLGVAFGGISYGDSALGASVRSGYIFSTMTLANNAVITQVNANSLQYSNVVIGTAGAFNIGANLTLSGNNVQVLRPSGDANVTVQNLTITNTGLTTITQGGGSGGVPYQVLFRPVALTVTAGSEYYVPSTVNSVTIHNGARAFVDGDSSASASFNLGTGSVGNANIVALETVNLTGAITISGDVYYYVYGSDTLTLSGTLAGTGAFNVATGSTGNFVNNTTTAAPGGSPEEPVEELPPVDDSQPGTDLVVDPKTSVELDGDRGDVVVSDGGVLKGDGSAENVTVVPGGTIAPNKGTLTILDTLNLSGIFAPGLLNNASYDQLAVGANHTGGGSAVNLNSGATFRVVLKDGWVIQQGDQFTIIDNLSSTDVNGTFAGLAEGAQFTVEGVTFNITYTGGDGNDIVITALNAGTDPTPPNTGAAELIRANPVTSAVLGLVAAAALIFIAVRRRATK